MPLPELGAARDVPRAVVPQRQLRAALRAGELVLHYQPLVSLGTGTVRGVEALVRWQCAPDTMLMPDDFLPAVIHTPVMHELTAWVIDEACAQAARWELPSMSVNVAAVDVVRPALVSTVADALSRHGLAPGRLVVELTEHAAVQGTDTAAGVLHDLRALGVGVALDDFGTGYSSLLYLRDLPVTEVKVDRTFVSGVGQRDDDAAIVQSVVHLAHAVGLTVVAEGVETPAQARFLHEAGCDFAQGYLYARAVPASEVPRRFDTRAVLPQRTGSTTTATRRGRGRRTPLPEDVRRTIAALVADGASLHTIAAALNREGRLAPNGARWSSATVAHALRDASVSSAAQEPPSRIRQEGPDR